MRAGLMLISGEGDGKRGLEEGGGRLMGSSLDHSSRIAMAMDIGFLRSWGVGFQWSTEGHLLLQ